MCTIKVEHILSAQAAVDKKRDEIRQVTALIEGWVSRSFKDASRYERDGKTKEIHVGETRVFWNLGYCYSKKGYKTGVRVVGGKHYENPWQCSIKDLVYIHGALEEFLNWAVESFKLQVFVDEFQNAAA